MILVEGNGNTLLEGSEGLFLNLIVRKNTKPQFTLRFYVLVVETSSALEMHNEICKNELSN